MLAGTSDIVTAVADRRATLFTDLDTLAQVRLARFQALVNLYKALGGGWTGARHGAAGHADLFQGVL